MISEHCAPRPAIIRLLCLWIALIGSILHALRVDAQELFERPTIHPSPDSVIQMGNPPVTSEFEVRVTSNGVLQFDKHDAGPNQTYLRILPHQRDFGNIPFAVRGGTHSNSGAERNNDVTIIGYGVSGGGGSQFPGEAGFALAFENHFEPEPGLDFKEFHLLHVDKLGAQRRPLSIILDNDDPSTWYGYNSLNRYFWTDPNNGQVYADLYRDGSTAANLKLTGSASGRGALIHVNSASHTLQLINVGMTNPDIHATSFKNLHVTGLRVVSGRGTAPVVVAGRDALGYITDVPLGPNITIGEDGMLTSLRAPDTASLQVVVMPWNQSVVTGSQERMNIPMQYDGYRIIETWLWNSDPGDQGITSVELRNVTREQAIAALTIGNLARASAAKDISSLVRGGDEISIEVKAHPAVPANGLRAVLVLTK